MVEVINCAVVQATYATVSRYLRRTPVITAGGEPGLDGVTLKLEQLQCSGSFKARGAFANLLLRDIPDAGVIAASGGNHGVAVAYAAARLGVRATVFVPTVSSPAKIDRIRRIGARLVVGGERYADALAASQEHALQTGAVQVHAFDQAETIMGQGTLALELAEQAPELDTVLVPVGGGGLIAGIAAYYAGSVRVVGVEPEGAPTLAAARKAGRPVDAPAGSIAADSLAPRRVGELVFPITQAHVVDTVLVGDEAIVAARRRLWESLRIVTEPAGAVAVAALLDGAYRPAAGDRVGVVISGANTNAAEVENPATTPGS